MWQRSTRPYVESGRLAVVGVVQEQHPDRAALYRQWRQLEWPVFVDSLNLLDLAVVPVPVAIDQHGIVRHLRLSPDQVGAEFVEKEYDAPANDGTPASMTRPDPSTLWATAERTATARAWRDAGDAFYLYADSDRFDKAVEAYKRAVTLQRDDGRAHFRLGVAFQARSESERQEPGDAQAAIEHWTRALDINPNQYIWRRRLQQYGPRLDKPYNFYFWVEQARDDIRNRGDKPVPLAAEPQGSEIAPPSRGGSDHAHDRPVNKDPEGRIDRDKTGMVQIDTVTVPSPVRPGHRARVRVRCRVNPKTRPYWNNEGEPLRLWVDATSGVAVGEGRFTFPNPAEPETQEPRALEFEVAVDADAAPGRKNLPAYALYYVCEKMGGRCRCLRQDFNIRLEVDPAAPTLR